MMMMMMTTTMMMMMMMMMMELLCRALSFHISRCCVKIYYDSIVFIVSILVGLCVACQNSVFSVIS
jgi:hypothetical protein